MVLPTLCVTQSLASIEQRKIQTIEEAICRLGRWRFFRWGSKGMLRQEYPGTLLTNFYSSQVTW